MVGRVAGGVDGLEAELGALHHVAVGEAAVAGDAGVAA